MLRDQAQAILLLSMNKGEDTGILEAAGMALQAIIPGSEMSESETETQNAAVDASRVSDSENEILRIAIPFTDMLLPVHQTGYQANHNLGLSNQKVTTSRQMGGGEIESSTEVKTNLKPGTNQISLTFDVKGSIRKISVLADIFGAASTAMASRTIKVTYLSPTMFIKNATLIGVNRASIPGSEKELTTLTVEIPAAEKKKKDQPKKETPKTPPPKSESFPLGPIHPPEGPLSVKGIPEIDRLKMQRKQLYTPKIQTAITIEEVIEELPEFREDYNFYRIDTLENIRRYPVPDFDSLETVQRQSYRVFTVLSMDAKGAIRRMVGVNYAGGLITMKDTESSKYREKLGLIRWLGDIYLAVKK